MIDGEAFFTIPEHLPHPVHVFSVLGMIEGKARAFDVRQTAHEFRVAAVDGTLWLLPIDSRQEALTSTLPQHQKGRTGPAVSLHTGDVACIRTDSGTARVAIETRGPAEMDQLIAWRKGILIFSNESAQTVVEVFNRYNPQKLVILDSDIAKLRLSGNFKLDDPGSFVLALEHLYPTSSILAERDPVSGAVLLLRKRSNATHGARAPSTS